MTEKEFAILNQEEKDQYQSAINLCMRYFNNDTERVELWMRTENPYLGEQTPIFMVQIGRGKKLLKMMKSALEEK